MNRERNINPVEELVGGQAYINGDWVAGKKKFDVVNPANGSVICQVADLEVADVRFAVTAAADAWISYKNVSVPERSGMLNALHELIQIHRHELAALITLESGKPYSESLGEVDYGSSFVEWYAAEARRSYGDTIPAPGTGNRIVTIKQSIGVVSAITSWNFPLAMVTRKIAPAVAAGCTVILRPASQTPLTALALARLVEAAGWPKGVFNVVTGTDSAGIGHELSANPLIRKLSFTGSTAVGKLLMEQAASTVKKISLELGGNAPFIVFDDANLDAAVKGVIYAKFRNAGQTCVAVNRLYVQDSIHDDFVQRLVTTVKTLRVGDGMSEDVQIGPLVNKKGLAKVVEHVNDARAKGAQLACGGKTIEGLFYEPTVLTDVTDDMLLACEETFGPIVSVFRFHSEGEVLKRANDSEYGLAAYFFSNDIHRCWRVAEGLETGMVGVNEGRISFAGAPFGGVKESGMGREGSKYGLDEFTELKYINFGEAK